MLKVLKYSLGTGNFSGKVNAPWGAKDVIFIGNARLLYSRYANLLRAFYAKWKVQVISMIMSYFKREQYRLRVQSDSCQLQLWMILWYND